MDMSAALTLKTNRIFNEVPDAEVNSIFQRVIGEAVSLVGRSDSGSYVDFRLSGRIARDGSFVGQYHTDKKLTLEAEITFSFCINDNKYLFKAILEKRGLLQGILHPQTKLFCLQRRAEKRLKVPGELFSVVRISQINKVMVRGFGRIIDISPNGLGICLPSDKLKLDIKDRIKVVLNVRSGPSEMIELAVANKRIRRRPSKGITGPLQEMVLGTMFIKGPSRRRGGVNYTLLMDLYRQVFESLLKV